MTDAGAPFVLWLVLVASLSVGSIAIQLYWLLGLAGLGLIARDWYRNGPSLPVTEPSRRLLLWALLLLVPALIAMLDAAAPERSARTLVRWLAYAVGAVALLKLPLARSRHAPLLTAAGVWLGVVVADGIWQYLNGFNVGGRALYQDDRYADRVTGFLGVDYGWVVAVLSPLLLETCRRLSPRGGFYWLALPAFLLVLLLSGSRASLLLMLVGFAGWSLLLAARWGRAALVAFLVPMLVATSFALATMVFSDALRLRWGDALGLFSADAEQISYALSYRPELWRAGWSIFTEHWLNGVGMRGFGQIATPYLAGAEGLPPKPQGWAPHLTVLEIGTDLGAIGLVAYALLYTDLLRWVWRAPSASLAPGLAALLALFPLGSTLSLFSARAGSTLWLMLTLAVALACHAQRADVEPTSSEDGAPCAES